MNLKMPRLQRALLAAGFGEVQTLLSSGNVVFSGRRASEATIARAVTAAVEQETGRTFGTIVRTIADLQALLDAEPYDEFRLPTGAKRVVTLLRQATPVALTFPIARDGAFILGLRGRELLSAYVPGEKGPVLMNLIEKHYGKDVTTRTWETLKKVARAGGTE